MCSPTSDKFELVDTGYGKSLMKVLHLQRDGNIHRIKEFDINLLMTLDYILGDNTGLIATDSVKNLLYVLVKLHGISTPEEFGLLICDKFMSKYPEIHRMVMYVDEHPWQRIQQDGVPHNHAFVAIPTAIRYSIVTYERGVNPVVEAGIKGLRILKSTKSAFVNYFKDEFATLPDTKDRIFSSIVESKWTYGSHIGIDFTLTWNKVKDSILEIFSGPAESGSLSVSHQNTIYLTMKSVLDRFPQISKVNLVMPNKHYFPVDMSKFSSVVGQDLNKVEEVFLPEDKRMGNVLATLRRKSMTAISKL